MTEPEGKKGGGLDKINPAAELGFSGDPGQKGDPGDDMLHAQRTWDAGLATNRLDIAGVDLERQRVEISGVTASVGVIVDGWADDMRRCLESVLEHTSAPILALDLGNVHGAGRPCTSWPSVTPSGSPRGTWPSSRTGREVRRAGARPVPS
ncbi:hypothetical protein [Nonomuraea recticatena]|uniref:hypothetical protein n=1 Tax=Nonomuraea recticatena TaxID=46178 RepID=UPI0036080318